MSGIAEKTREQSKVDVSKEDIYLKGHDSHSMFQVQNVKYDRSIKTRNFDGEQISLFYDRMFKAMFQNQKRVKFPAKFLSYFLDLEYEEILKNLKYRKSEFDLDTVDDKNSQGDFVVGIGNTLVNIECNNTCVMYRNLDYMDRLSRKKVKIRRYYDFQRVIAINLNNYYREGMGIYDVNFRSNKNGKIIIYKVSLDIYVPKIVEKMYNEGVKSLSEAEKCILVMVLTDKKLVKQLAKGDKIMEEYVEEAEFVRSDYPLEAYDHEQDWIDGQMEIAKAEGREEGREEAQAERFNVAKNMVNKGIDFNTIVECFHFSPIESEKLKLML